MAHRSFYLTRLLPFCLAVLVAVPILALVMQVPARALTRPAAVNTAGLLLLRAAEERLPAPGLARLRAALWTRRLYLYVTPGPELVGKALAIFPEPVRALGARCPFHRYDARGGGGYWPDQNEVWLAAGVETYEGTRQVVLSARHEMFHFIAHNDPRYRPDDDASWPALWGALEKSRPHLDAYPRYRDWIRRSFVVQGDHGNPTELFADIPTNFPDPAEIPPPLRAYFAPLLDGSAGGPDAVPARSPGDLDAFHRLIAGADA